MINVKSLVILIVTLSFSVLGCSIFKIPIWVTLLMACLWVIFWKLKKCKWIVFLFVIMLVLFLNRLLSFSPISFDREQSFLSYPGISISIQRYYKEGLIIPYFIRKIFYGQYLLIFPWFNNFFKQISPIFWVRLIGFSGFYLFGLGLIESIKRKLNYWIISWFLVVIFTASLRVIGDSVMAAYLALPSVIYLIYFALNTNNFKYKYWIWFLLLLVDFLLK